MLSNKIAYAFGLALYISIIFVVLAFTVLSFYALVDKKNWGKKLLFILLGMSYLAFYINFNVQHTFVHNMHFRYVLPLAIVQTIGMAQGVKKLTAKMNLKEQTKKVMSAFIRYGVLENSVILIVYLIEILIATFE